jgi:hypothetical protein
MQLSLLPKTLYRLRATTLYSASRKNLGKILSAFNIFHGPPNWVTIRKAASLRCRTLSPSITMTL